MTSEARTDLPYRRGRSDYAGFRAVIKAVGTGPRGSRALTFDEARDATAALIAGDVSPVQAGAFLIAMRIKGEAPAELAGMTQALRDAARSVAPDPPSGGRNGRTGRPIVACAGAFDGMSEAPHLSLAAAVLAAAAGARVVVHCGGRLGPKRGTTAADVLVALGGPLRPKPAESLAMLERSDVALVHAGAAIPGWDALAAIRDEIGLRGPLHTAEKLVDHLGATRFVVGHTHSSYRERILGALTLLGAQRSVAVRGMEGADILRAGRPSAADANGPLDIPEAPGAALRGDPDPQIAAELTRAIMAGDDHGVAAHTALLSAAVRLYAAGRCETVSAGVALATAAVEDGRATATLEALLAT
jgi:anthranilate phosphoribosyltransferase